MTLHKNPKVSRHHKDVRTYNSRNEDPYQSRGKYQEPCCCTGCGAIYKKGHWSWGEAEAGAQKHLCPACQRTLDREPAGIVTISGDFCMAHQQEILNMLHNFEAKEKTQHPLQRIMNISMKDGSITAHLTDFHITKGIIDALRHAFQGESEVQFVDKNGVMRGSWRR